MNTHKTFGRIVGIIYSACMVLAITPVQAQEAPQEPTKMLVYISPQEYDHSIKLWHYYYNYWYEQGPAVEPVALKALNAEYGDVKMCQGNDLGKALMWIKPRMYYNPQLEVFYGEITANIFSGHGRILGTYKGDSRKHGYLDVYPERQVEDAYKLAMQDLMKKIKADEALQRKISDSIASTESSSCALVALLPPAKANDWGHYLESPGY